MLWGLVKLTFWVATLPLRVVGRLFKFMLFLTLPIIAMNLLRTVMSRSASSLLWMLMSRL